MLAPSIVLTIRRGEYNQTYFIGNFFGGRNVWRHICQGPTF